LGIFPRRVRQLDRAKSWSEDACVLSGQQEAYIRLSGTFCSGGGAIPEMKNSLCGGNFEHIFLVAKELIWYKKKGEHVPVESLP